MWHNKSSSSSISILCHRDGIKATLQTHNNHLSSVFFLIHFIFIFLCFGGGGGSVVVDWPFAHACLGKGWSHRDCVHTHFSASMGFHHHQLLLLLFLSRSWFDNEKKTQKRLISPLSRNYMPMVKLGLKWIAMLYTKSHIALIIMMPIELILHWLQHNLLFILE